MIYITCSGALSRERLTKDLLENYVKSVKPEPSDGSRFKVTLGLTLLNLDDVDDDKKVIETHAYMDHIWRDERLAWEPSEYDDVRTLHLPADSIWIPDVVLSNNADDDYKPMIDMTVLVFSDGTINYIPPLHLKSFCETVKQPTGVSNRMYIDRYKELVCKLTFLSWMYDGQEVSLVNRSSHIDLSEFRHFPADKFQVKSTAVQVDPKKFPCCAETYDIATFTIVLSNDPKYYHDNAPISDHSPTDLDDHHGSVDDR
ncbi:hypothetical protein ACJMK2_031315 [Sinanodonta woodiana]|uniref:Neurotransmitter-gated ion-channel ligand-binding domain-containing protein n=1 Tax=Sinanodonta woodiana TaxID=1069815 RepID=A0ABD3X1X3_SINWO